jgi:hypothetical protein
LKSDWAGPFKQYGPAANSPPASSRPRARHTAPVTDVATGCPTTPPTGSDPAHGFSATPCAAHPNHYVAFTSRRSPVSPSHSSTIITRHVNRRSVLLQPPIATFFLTEKQPLVSALSGYPPGQWLPPRASPEFHTAPRTNRRCQRPLHHTTVTVSPTIGNTSSWTASSGRPLTLPTPLQAPPVYYDARQPLHRHRCARLWPLTGAPSSWIMCRHGTASVVSPPLCFTSSKLHTLPPCSRTPPRPTWPPACRNFGRHRYPSPWDLPALLF